MNIESRKTIHDTLSKYDVLVNKGSNDDFIEVTEWNNGEGFTIAIGDKKLIDLSHGEIAAINYLKDTLYYGNI